MAKDMEAQNAKVMWSEKLYKNKEDLFALK